MPIKVKVDSTSTGWKNVKKVFAKVSTSNWATATGVWIKNINGWVKAWPGNAPASNPSDPINIRLTSYNGAVATSPQYINTKLYGNDGSFTGDTPITVSNRKMYISESSSGNTTRYQLETTDIYDLTSNAEANIGYKRFMADGWWLFYQLTASNTSDDTILYSPPIKIIRQAPTFVTNSPTLSEDYSTSNPFLSINFEFSDTWWKAADLSRSYVKWWQNTSPTPGGTALRTTYIQNISGLLTNRSGTYSDYNGTGTTVFGTDSYTVIGGIPANQYIIAEVVLINSYTDHYSTTVSAYKSTGIKPTITALTVTDDNGNGVVDNQSTPRVISDGWLNFTATVTGALSTTYYLLEPRIYNWQTGTYYDYNTTTVIGSTSFPTDLTPTTTSLSGTTATVTWRTYINADTLYGMGGPTYSGGSSRWELEFRVSARASSTSTNASASYFSGIASLGTYSIYLGGIDIPGGIDIAPSSAMTLNVSSTTTQANSPVIFNISTVSYPSGYSSYPRRYYIDYGDGTNSGWISFSTGTSNPSVASISKTYTSIGTYTATLKWDPQGDPGRSTRSRTITVSQALNPPTNISLSVSRSTDTSVSATVTGTGGSGPYYQMYWTTGNTTPVTGSYDAASTTNSVTDILSPSANFTYYFYMRSSSENLGNTTLNGNGTAGTYSAYSAVANTPSYYFTVPSGGTATSTDSGGNTISSITSGGTIYLTKSDATGSPSPTGITIVWRRNDGGTGGNTFTGGSIRQNGGTSYTTVSADQTYSIRPEVTWNNGVGSQTANGGAVLVSAPATKLATPTNVNASDTRTDGVQVSWTNVANAATYGVWWGGAPSYDSTPDFGGPNNNGGKTITSSPFLDDVITAGTTRDYYVQAFPSVGSTAYLKSDWSLGNSGTRITNPTYNVNWNANGGSVTPASSSGTQGTVVSAPTPTRTGYTFLYWRDSLNVFSYLYQINPGGTWTIGSSDITFYAWWQQNTVNYTVTWNANGGSVSPSSTTVSSGSQIQAPTPTRSGYTFNGWYDSSSGGNYVVGAGGNYIVNSSVTLYAQWTIVQACTCSYTDQGTYYFSPQCCSTGSANSGLPTVYNSGNSVCTSCYSSTSTGSCCPNISKLYTKCSANDVSSSSSPVYFYCYSTGQCINSSQGAGGTC